MRGAVAEGSSRCHRGEEGVARAAVAVLEPKREFGRARSRMEPRTGQEQGSREEARNWKIGGMSTFVKAGRLRVMGRGGIV